MQKNRVYMVFWTIYERSNESLFYCTDYIIIICKKKKIVLWTAIYINCALLWIDNKRKHLHLHNYWDFQKKNQVVRPGSRLINLDLWITIFPEQNHPMQFWFTGQRILLCISDMSKQGSYSSCIPKLSALRPT